MGSRTFLRQATQIRNSTSYDDTLAAGSTLQSSSENIEMDLNALRSQMKRAIGDTAWHTDIATINGKKRAIKDLNTDLDELEEQRVLARVANLTDIAVPALQNFVVLSVGDDEAPTQVAAVGASAVGAVVAQSDGYGAAFEAHELDEVAGTNAIDPKNLCLVRDSTTGQPVQSDGKDVFALLQFESTGSDGDAFDDVSEGSRAKLSFVIMNAGLDDLVACPVGDIAGKTVNYSYVRRLKFDDMPEEYWLNGHTFTDHTTQVDVTRQRAYNNQGTTPVELANNADLDLGASIEWTIRDAANADLLQVIEGSSGSTSTVKVAADVDMLDINAAVVDVASGVKANTSGTRPIHVGVNDGVIESTAGDLRMFATGEMFLDDGNQTGSTWAQTSGIKLSDTTAEWDSFETEFGEVSLLAAIVSAKNSSTVTKTYAVVNTTVNENSDVSLADGNIDVALPDLSIGSFANDYDVYLNGQLLRSGANSGADNDYYPGSAGTKLKFEFKVHAGDVLCVVARTAQ
jgi:hypothetical protein